MNNFASNFIVRLRGLPWTANQNDIRHFLQGCQIRQIQFVTKDQGRPTGECFVIMQSGEDVQLAKTYDKRLISNRYIEVFQSNSDEMAQMLRKINTKEILSPLMNSPMDSQWKEPVVRLRGLPYNATKDDVKNFFTGLDIAQNGVHISSSKPAGEAFVAFMNMDNAHRALDFNRKNIGHRYIEIFKSTYAEARASIMSDTETTLRQKANYSNQHPFASDNSQPPSDAEYNNTMNQYGAPAPAMAPLPSSNYYSEYEPPTNQYPTQTMSHGSLKRPMSKPFLIKMRGVPFEAGQKEIFEFFSPVVPIHLEQENASRGRPPVWYAEFGSREEATEAMTFDKQYMGSRYIELFPMYDELPSKMMRS